MKIVKIVTHHENTERAAELFAEEGVVAVGWAGLGNLKKLTYNEIKQRSKKLWDRTEREAASDASQLIMFRDEVNVGDIVFAYKGSNKVALVGEVIGDYRFNRRNKVGDPKGKIGYPNQRKVKWWDSPRNFDRHFLPRRLSEWVARPGTIAIREYDMKKLKDILRKIPSHETVIRALEIQSEDEIKDYIERHLGDVEEGLKVIKREYPTSVGPMDFLAKDKDGIDTVIEVKIRAEDRTVTQLRRYMRSYKKDSKVAKVRGIIVAEEFTKRCLDDVEELKELGMDIRLYECKKKFSFAKKEP